MGVPTPPGLAPRQKWGFIAAVVLFLTLWLGGVWGLDRLLYHRVYVPGGQAFCASQGLASDGLIYNSKGRRAVGTYVGARCRDPRTGLVTAHQIAFYPGSRVLGPFVRLGSSCLIPVGLFLFVMGIAQARERRRNGAAPVQAERPA